MPEIRLIASDMDGTLFNSERDISKRNVEAILAAQKKGVIFSLCTGRIAQFGALNTNIRGISCPTVGSNGGSVWDDEQKKVVASNPIPMESALRVHDLLRHIGVHYYAIMPEHIASSDVNIVHPNATVYDGAMTRDYGVTFSVGADAMEKTVYSGLVNKFYVPRQPDEIYEKISEGLAEIGDIYVTTSGKNCCEIMKAGVNKRSGVEMLAAMYGISMENVMTLGDYENDVPMLSAAGLGVAMGNAPDEVKACAKYVTDTNNNDGVAKAIEKFVL